MAKQVADKRIAYRFSVMSTLHTRALADMHTRKFGLSVNCWWVMAVIGRFPGSSASSVAGHTTLEPDKVTRATDTLVKKGFVIRRRDRDDRRRVVLSLSAKGQKVFDAIEQVRRAMEGAYLGALTNDELDAFYLCLDKLEQRGKQLFSERHAWKKVVEGAELPSRVEIAVGSGNKA